MCYILLKEGMSQHAGTEEYDEFNAKASMGRGKQDLGRGR